MWQGGVVAKLDPNLGKLNMCLSKAHFDKSVLPQHLSTDRLTCCLLALRPTGQSERGIFFRVEKK